MPFHQGRRDKTVPISTENRDINLCHYYQGLLQQTYNLGGTVTQKPYP